MPLLTTPALPAGSLAALSQPTIARNGVILRAWEESDAAAVVAAYADPAIQRWHCWSLSGDEALRWIAGWPRKWQEETGASWAVVVDGKFAGQVGLRGLQLEEGLAKISYWVLPETRGKRVAPRALEVMSRWAFGTLGLHRLELNHSTANAASCRVALRCGFLLEGTKRSEALHADGWHDMHTHARLTTDPSPTV
ncbi:GNAT family N-acetyltransferase [Actinoplanes sp. NEAU-A12]|uniref:GNAT family N-acetyltransferase n=1 Tax=Actinoplanes sandaracinus TaxID=3045177 RepID=A0ABT6WIX0_9ACTN|nr:GNAT family N-acetyltransferase [Actinoplanes sandaracinus]MDI6099669.1 GNAT family N-acetyltransferase [Actinoplanes sandaracinus]